MKALNAFFRFIAFWFWAVLQVPTALILLPFGRRAGVWQFGFFAKGCLKIAGIRVKVHGCLSKNRPLLLVGNHISIFEFMTIPATFGGTFFGKDDIAKIPFVGLMARFWGVIFVSRRREDALRVVKQISDELKRATWPMAIYPEGTTTNGSVILPFKSSMFSFIENGVKATIQPMVMFYRDRCGNPIPDQVLADDFAYFANEKMPAGAALCRKERGPFMQMFHVFELGGFTVELHLLPPPPLADMNRKEIAETLHKIINDEFIKLKDKRYENSYNTNKG